MSEQVGSLYYDVTLETAGLIAGQRKVDAALGNTTRSIEAMDAKLTKITQAVQSYAAALYLIAQSDAYTKMTAQLKLATDSASDFAAAQARVKTIAAESQSDISAISTLYARITNATKEMGLSQNSVGEITRAVSLAMKVSGASAQESASAMLQLSQAFASGAMRGEEFNTVSETAPRLMKALADGMGVPIGQLRSMAAEGKLTSEVMAATLPKALAQLEVEAKSVQTISGAFQELKNELTLFIGEQASANGVVKLITGSIGLLADNVTMLAGVLGTVAAVKFAVWLQAVAAQAYQNVAANQALLTSNVATAQAQVAATSATAALTAARVMELRQAVLSAEGNVALAITTNGLIPAQARATAAATAHTAALAQLSAAQSAASATGRIAGGVMGALGGPIGLITTLLGIGATAWAVWGNSAKDESAKAASEVQESGREIIASLERQNEKLRERIALAKAGQVEAAKGQSKGEEALASKLAEINKLKAKGNAITGSDRIVLIELEAQYQDIARALEKNRNLTGQINDLGQESKAQGWMAKYATDAERVAAEIAKAKKELGDAFTPELEQRIRAKITPDKKPAKTPAERFDSEAYLSSLRKAQASEINTINETEAEKLRIAKRNLDGRKISEAEYQEAVTLITAAAESDRAELMRKTQEKIDADRKEADRQALEDRKAHAEEVRKAMEYGATLTKAVNPVDALRQEYEAKLALVTQYEQMMAAQGVDATLQAQMARTQITNEHELQRRALAEQTFRSQGEAQAFLIDSVNALSSTATSSIVGLLDGTMSAQDAMRSLASTVLNEAVGALVQMGVQQVKNALLADTLAAADAAKRAANGAVYAASISAQVTGMSALAAQNAFAATAAIPIVGPALAPAAAAAAGTAAMALGTPAIATAPIAGARQYGGPVSAGSMYRVNEGGRPEMFTAANGNQYLMPTQGGRVTPMGSGGGGAASSGGGGGWVGDINITVAIAQDGSARASTESTGGDATLARQIGDRIAIGTKETMLKELRPGGLLWKLKMGQA